MAKTIMAAFIPADEKEAIELVHFEPGDITFMQEKVGGYFDVADSQVHEASLWFDDEGKIKKRDVNARATLILWLENRWRDVDAIVGDVLVTGQPDETGVLTSIPESLLDGIAGMYNWKYEVQTGGDDWSGNQVICANYFEAIAKAVGLSRRWMLVTAIRVVQA